MSRATQRGSVVAGSLLLASVAFGHGDTAPSEVDDEGLPRLGEAWLDENPYRTAQPDVLAKVLEVGSRGYNSNCARCHGLEVISGGLAPDLRNLEPTAYGDEWYRKRIREGYSQNGVYKMPPYEDILSQEAAWAIRTYVETRPNLNQLKALTPEVVSVRQKLEMAKEKAQVSELAHQLKTLADKVKSVSGGSHVDTPMGRAAAFLAQEPARVDRALAVLTEEIDG